MKLETQISANGGRPLLQSIASGDMTAKGSEPFIYGGYLEVWFRCLKLSKQYIHNCRTGLFGSQGAANTLKLFGCLEHCTLREWWLERGCENFGRSMAPSSQSVEPPQNPGRFSRIVQVRGPAHPSEQCGELLCWVIRPISRKKMINLYIPEVLISERVTWKSDIKLPDCWLLPIRPPEDETDTVEIESLDLKRRATSTA